MHEAKFGSHFGECGFLVEKKQTTRSHRFGGASWRLVDDDPLCGGPTLLLVLDLTDPALRDVVVPPELDELPLCSYVNALVWAERQRYQVNQQTRTVALVERESESRDCLDPEDCFPNPLQEVPVSLVSMGAEDLPTDEQHYWAACEEFVGGRHFIRVLGSPLWLEQPHLEVCRCADEMKYLAAIGTECYDQPSGILPGQAFFIGEGALYFFWCAKCSELSVISQAT